MIWPIPPTWAPCHVNMRLAVPQLPHTSSCDQEGSHLWVLGRIACRLICLDHQDHPIPPNKPCLASPWPDLPKLPSLNLCPSSWNIFLVLKIFSSTSCPELWPYPMSQIFDLCLHGLDTIFQPQPSTIDVLSLPKLDIFCWWRNSWPMFIIMTWWWSRDNDWNDGDGCGNGGGGDDNADGVQQSISYISSPQTWHS